MPDAADVTTVNGVRGFLDAADGTFWVTRHLGPGAMLDQATIAKLRGLLDVPSPRLSSVRVLFSLAESAAQNRDTLAAAGIGAFYVDPDSGAPREA